MLLALVMSATATAALAQPPAEAPPPAPAAHAPAHQSSEPRVHLQLRNLTRADTWRFFEPQPGGGDPRYSLFGNRATLEASVEGRRFQVRGSFQYAQLLGLPPQAIGPGPLGPGPMYFFHARNTKAFQLYIRTGSIRVADLLPGLSIQGGRMTVESDAGTPAAGRLIGSADWSVFERAFDGAQASYARAGWTVEASYLLPTQGAYEESASPTIVDVRVASAALTRGRLRAFAYDYDDSRRVRARPDNSGRAADRVDVRIRTVGASYTRGWGTADRACGPDDDDACRAGRVHAWAAAQHGHWFEQPHRAFSASAETSYAWRARAWRPQIDAGVSYASGDADGNDARHQTFFPMLPTSAPPLLGGTYAHMNLRDLYARLHLQPHRVLSVAGEAHHLSLAQPGDRWYSGTGATAFEGTYFGYTSRASRLARGLGTVALGRVELRAGTQWTLRASAAVIRGGDVVRRQFARPWLSVLQVESAFHWPLLRD